MNILLIQPESGARLSDKVYLHEPLALEYLGAGLKADGHEVTLLDARLEPGIEAVCLRERPDLVGLTGYTSQVHIIQGIAARVKTLLPDLFVVVGGHHATVRPADFNDLNIDLVVIGEGVSAIREIARCLEKRAPLRDIAGLAFPGEEMEFSGPRPYTDLDRLPFPDRSLTAKYRRHYFSEWMRPLASIRTSVGCTNHCNFCALWTITGGKYLRRNPERVVEELRTIEEPNVFFCDDESMRDVRRMDRLADRIREAGVRKRYFLYARADTIVRNPKLFAKWRDIGLVQVFVGMESFSDERLRGMKKGITTEQQEAAVRILGELGVLLYASFVVDPGFTRDDFRALRRYIRRLKIRYATFSVLTPLPGTRLYAERLGDLREAIPEHFDFLHTLLPTALPLPEFYSEFARLYQNAVPLRYRLRTLGKYGLRGGLNQLKFLKPALTAIREGHLDHGETPADRRSAVPPACPR